MIVVLTAGGPVDELPDLSLYKDAVHIGVDAGVVTLLGQCIEPLEAIGDFDSVSDDEYEQIRAGFPSLERSPADKDESDTELALEKAMHYRPETVIITGVTGGRLDHYMAALHIVFAYQRRYPDVEFLVLNKQNRIRFMEPGEFQMEPDPAYDFVSFYPFAEQVSGLTIEGFKYTVQDEEIPFGSTRFISNELSECGTVKFTGGHLIIIESSD
ncbi:thiamine diphosphokinase [Planococcus sp. ISL-109]|uniref:thiamine diphosphokinase n=1 Tax=Planococcus sp. ISL-109 TaxID=2819166 RepID=UPI001BEC93C1|nr:thiamine diphosphokinase [Planococcus sp. ISL-109]